MFDVGGGELLFIVLIILLLFGPKKIPELMRNVGSGLRQFRRAQEDLTRQIRDLSTQDPTVSATATRTVIQDDIQPDNGPDASLWRPQDDVADAEDVPDTPADSQDTPPAIIPQPAPSSQPRPRRTDTPQEPLSHD